ncbi:glycosyltransferase [bacterium]|nr:glycosyltransferase [bacterium]
MSILVLTHSFPPKPSGSAIVMRNVLLEFPENSYYVITQTSKAVEKDVSFDDRKMPLYRMKLPRRADESYKLRLLFMPVIFAVSLWLCIRKKCDRILSVYPCFAYLIVGYLLSRALKLKYYLYMHDTFEEAVGSIRILAWLAVMFEKRAFSSATHVFVLTKGLQKLYQKKYPQIETVLIPHSIVPDSAVSSKNINVRKFNKNDEITIAFTGAVTLMNVDTLAVLVEAIQQIKKYKIRLIITTRSDKKWLSEHGISGDNVTVDYKTDKQEVLNVQRSADILFLPMAFDSPFPIETQTALPTKTFEYMGSGVPILVLAPEDAHLTEFVSLNMLSFSVTDKSVASLKDGIIRLIENRENRIQIVQNALNSIRQYNSKKVSDHFLQTVIRN